jgi:hypothetical protein
LAGAEKKGDAAPLRSGSSSGGEDRGRGRLLDDDLERRRRRHRRYLHLIGTAGGERGPPFASLPTPASWMDAERVFMWHVRRTGEALARSAGCSPSVCVRSPTARDRKRDRLKAQRRKRLGPPATTFTSGSRAPPCTARRRRPGHPGARSAVCVRSSPGGTQRGRRTILGDGSQSAARS